MNYFNRGYEDTFEKLAIALFSIRGPHFELPWTKAYGRLVRAARKAERAVAGVPARPPEPLNLERLRAVSTDLMKKRGIRGSVGVYTGIPEHLKKLDPDILSEIIRKMRGGAAVTHASPQVIMMDSNAVGAIGRNIPEVPGAARFLRGMREGLELEPIQAVLPNFEFGKTRLSRHARKRIGELIHATATPEEYDDLFKLFMTVQPSGHMRDPDIITRRMKQLPKNKVDISGPIMLGRSGESKQPIVGGGTGVELMNRLNPLWDQNVGSMKPLDKEVINRSAIMHEGMEGDVNKQLENTRESIESWGVRPYHLEDRELENRARLRLRMLHGLHRSI